MSFFIFVLYYIICTIILGVIIFFIFKIFLRHKMNPISKIAEKEISNYFNFYDDNFDYLDDNKK